MKSSASHEYVGQNKAVDFSADLETGSSGCSISRLSGIAFDRADALLGGSNKHVKPPTEVERDPTTSVDHGFTIQVTRIPNAVPIENSSPRFRPFCREVS